LRGPRRDAPPGSLLEEADVRFRDLIELDLLGRGWIRLEIVAIDKVE
jgi:hypothetical protein